MATITTLNSGDSGPVSRGVINTNLANLNTDKIETSVLDTDVALTADSDLKVATQKAVKTYVDGVATISTSGVSTGPASSSTQTITHGLGKLPTIIRIYAIGGTNTTAGFHGNSIGTYNSTGNRCLYIVGNSSTKASATSTAFAVRLSTNAAGTESAVATGVIGNITGTTFDIVWTAAGDISANSFLWEAQ